MPAALSGYFMQTSSYSRAGTLTDAPVCSEKIQLKGTLHLPGGPKMDSPGIQGGESRACTWNVRVLQQYLGQF